MLYERATVLRYMYIAYLLLDLFKFGMGGILGMLREDLSTFYFFR